MICDKHTGERMAAAAAGQFPAGREGATGGVFTKQTHFGKTNPFSRPGRWPPRGRCAPRPGGPGSGSDCLTRKPGLARSRDPNHGRVRGNPQWLGGYIMKSRIVVSGGYALQRKNRAHFSPRSMALPGRSSGTPSLRRMPARFMYLPYTKRSAPAWRTSPGSRSACAIRPCRVIT